MATITAKRSADSNSAIELNATLSLTVNKGDQATFVFDKTELSVGLKNTTASNIATGGTGNGAITYSIDNTSVATVDNNGQLTLKSIGKATVTASKAGNANYSTISNSYELTVNNKKEQSSLRFQQASITLDYQVGGVTTSNAIVSGGNGSGAITYRSDNEAIATVNNKGVVTIKSAGKTKIRATKAEDKTYNPIEANYDLTVNKIAPTGFGFAQSTVTATLTDKTVKRTVTRGEGNGLITYESNNTGVATVDNDGVVTIHGAGTAIITAHKAEDTNYKAVESRYVLVVNKAQQTGFGFARGVFTVAYAKDKKISNIIAQGGQGAGAITYKIDKTSVATIDSTNGVLTLKSTGTATITAMKAGDDDYLPTSATYSLKVMEFSTNSTLILGTKNIKFTWSDVAGTDHYRLLSDLGGGFVDASTSSFVVVPNSNNIKQTNARADIALHRYIPLLNGNDPLYRVESCDNANTCSDNAVLNASLSNAELNQLIGHIKASNRGALDFFGSSVSISGDGNTLAVGAFLEDTKDSNQDNAGAAYVFVRDSSSAEWSQQAYIKGDNTGTFDNFGFSISLSDDGNSLAVGAYNEGGNSTGVNVNGEQNNDTLGSGAVYVFTRSGTNWSQQAYIKASNNSVDNQFGWSVSLSDDGNTLAVGSHLEDSNSTGVDSVGNNNSTNTGAVYVFTRRGEDWSQQAYIKASNSGVGDQFGYSVSLSGDGNTLAVGAWGEDSSSTGVDSLENNNSTDTGAVYVFTRRGDDWSQQAYIKASNSGDDDEFGTPVSLSDDGNTLAVGADNEDGNSTGVGGEQNNNSTNTGAVYVFNRSGTVWSQQAYIKASNSGADDQFWQCCEPQ